MQLRMCVSCLKVMFLGHEAEITPFPGMQAVPLAVCQLLPGRGNRPLAVIP